MFCPHCHNKIPDGSNFCPLCYANLVGVRQRETESAERFEEEEKLYDVKNAAAAVRKAAPGAKGRAEKERQARIQQGKQEEQAQPG